MVIKLADKERYCISEIVPFLKNKLYISDNAARMKIYRGINDGSIRAKSYLGSIRIERAEVERILEGEIL